MSDPWELKKDDTRHSDTLPTFIIFCEDTVSEPIYFKFFETPKTELENLKDSWSRINDAISETSGNIETLKEQLTGEAQDFKETNAEKESEFKQG